jgi:hypothetical protein
VVRQQRKPVALILSSWECLHNRPEAPVSGNWRQQTGHAWPQSTASARPRHHFSALGSGQTSLTPVTLRSPVRGTRTSRRACPGGTAGTSPAAPIVCPPIGGLSSWSHVRTWCYALVLPSCRTLTPRRLPTPGQGTAYLARWSPAGVGKHGHDVAGLGCVAITRLSEPKA